jgi:hypothetical protein
MPTAMHTKKDLKAAVEIIYKTSKELNIIWWTIITRTHIYVAMPVVRQ